jgi:hypothetical protein
VVVARDGTFLALGQTAAGNPTTYESFAVRGRPGAWWPPVTRFQAMANVLPDLMRLDDKRSKSWAVTSVDGVAWQRESSLEPAGSNGFRAATALSDGRIAAVSGGATTASPPPEGCPSVFYLGGLSLIKENLGCNRIPTSIVQLKDGRLAASVGEHLWLREPTSRLTAGAQTGDHGTIGDHVPVAPLADKESQDGPHHAGAPPGHHR